MRVLKKSITLPTEAASRRAAPQSNVQPDADLLLALTSELKEAHDAFSRALALDDKNYVRGIHMSAKQISPGYSPSLVRQRFELRKQYFKTGSQIDPTKIQPKLYLAEGTFWEDLFKITRACWSMPYNKGYGRRLRFVVFDDYHEAVMGVIGLQSPPADLKSRDDLFSCVPDTKLAMVNNTMDAFTVGAIPPYSFLLGGKLCAGMISTETIRRAYWRKYAGKKSTTQDSTIPQPLVAVTTTSAFGRSSIYNRLKYKDRLLAEPIGYTQGFGTIHLEHLYPRIVELLKSIGKFTPAGWGNGPKVRWQSRDEFFAMDCNEKFFFFGLLTNWNRAWRAEVMEPLLAWRKQTSQIIGRPVGRCPGLNDSQIGRASTQRH
jgi:hypothetical protein